MLITGFAVGSAETNCYLVAARAGSGAIVIDPGDEAVPTLEYYCAVNELTPAAVLLTCGKPEHTASAFDVCAGWDVPAYLHPADRHLLDDPPDQVLAVSDGQSLRIADVVVAVDHTPGHTDGSVVFRVTADSDGGPVGVAFTGDTLLCRSVGATDNLVRLLGSIREKLLVLDDDTVVLPGHGTSTSIGAERRSNPFLKDLTA